jgi:hypothetical protein
MIYLDVLKSAVESRNVMSVSDGVDSTYSSMGRYMHMSHNICRSCLTQASTALLGYYARKSGNSLPTFWDN